MILEDMIKHVHNALGRPTSVQIYDTPGDDTTFDIALAGSLLITNWINYAYKRLASWIIPGKGTVHFDALDDEIFFQAVSYTGTASAGANQTITLTPSSSSDDDRYNGWIIELTGGTGSGQRMLIIDYVGATGVATVHKTWATNPDATSTYKMYTRVYNFYKTTHNWVADGIPLDPVSTILQPIHLQDLSTLRPVFRATDKVESDLFIMTPGIPTNFMMYRNGIMFNYPIDAVTNPRSYRLHYYSVPVSLSAAADIPIFKEAWHIIIADLGIWWGQKMLRMTTSAWATKQDIDDEILRTMQDGESGAELVEEFGYVG